MDYAVAVAAIKQSDRILAPIIEQIGVCQLDQVQQTGDLFY